MAERIPGAVQIANERQRQIEQKGYTADHDVFHDPWELVHAAIAYAVCASDLPLRPDTIWPWESSTFKPEDTKANLVRAGALLAAAIDRMP